MHIALHILFDYLNFTCSVVGARKSGDDLVRVVSAKIMNNNRNVEHYKSFPIALIVGSDDVIFIYVIMIRNFSVVWICWIERAILFLTDATYTRNVASLLLFPTELIHFAVLLQMFDYLCLPFNELVENLLAESSPVNR